VELMNKIKEAAELEGIDNIKIAEHIGVTSSSITYYFDGSIHINFNKFIKMVHLIYKSGYDNLIIEYCRYCDRFPKRKPQSVREALDWSLGRFNSELTQYLLELEKIYSPKTYEIYNLLFMSRERKITPDEFFEAVHHLPYNLKGIKKKDLPQIKVLIDLCRMYYYDYTKNYRSIFSLSKLTFKEIEKVSSEFLKYSYTLCVKEMLTVYYLKYNKLKECNDIVQEMVSDEVRNLFPLSYFYGLSKLAEMHMFTNYKHSLHYIQEAISEMKRLGFEDYKRKYEHFKSNHDLIKLLNFDFENLYLNDIDQRLYYLSLQNDAKSKKEAQNIINKLESEDELDEFQTCYKAILNKDIRLMIRAEEMFMESCDFYYVNIPRKYIKEWRCAQESK